MSPPLEKRDERDESAVPDSAAAPAKSADPPAASSDQPIDQPFLDDVYDQLRAIARARLSDESNSSLQCTDLVHEAYLRMVDHPAIKSRSRAAFFHCAAEAMRRVLIDHARTRKRLKRGGGVKPTVIDVAQLARDGDSNEILALDEAICRLEAQQPESARIVKLRFFTGLTVEEAAEVTGLSTRTVKREWAYARAWLFRELSLQ